MNTKAPTEAGRQWMWFVLLWSAGLGAAALLAAAVRWVLRL